MKRFEYQGFALFCTVVLVGLRALHAQEAGEAPVGLQAAVLSEALGFDKALTGEITVYVLGDARFAAELRKSEGKTVGETTIAAVRHGGALPANKPDVLFVGNASALKDAIRYTREAGILSITGLPELVADGVTLGVGVVRGKPKVLLNTTASKEEGRKWDSALIKIAKTYE